MPAVPSVLLVEDNPADARLLQEMVLGNRRARSHPAPLPEARRRHQEIERRTPTASCSTSRFPTSTASKGSTALRAEFPEIPIVILTGLDDEEVALEALRAGAQDYLVKGSIEGDGVKRAVRYAIERKSAEGELARLGRQNELILELGRRRNLRPGRFRAGSASPIPRRRSSSGWRAGGPGRQDRCTTWPEGPDPMEAGIDAADCPIQTVADGGEPLTVRRGILPRSDATTFPVEYSSTPISPQGPLGRRGDLQGHHGAKALRAAAPVSGRPRRAHRTLQPAALRRGATRSRSPSASALRGGVGAARPGHRQLQVHQRCARTPRRRRADPQPRGSVQRRFARTDIVSRLGGDEFGILLDAGDASEARSVAEELLAMVRGHRPPCGDRPCRSRRASASRCSTAPNLTPEQLLIEADVAMYEAKDAGRDACHLSHATRPRRTPSATGLVWTRPDQARPSERTCFVVHASRSRALGRRRGPLRAAGPHAGRGRRAGRARRLPAGRRALRPGRRRSMSGWCARRST